MHKDIDALLHGPAGREDRVVTLQSALTACPALGPDNGGDGEQAKAAIIAAWLKACGIKDLLHVDAPDSRVSSGVRPNLFPASRADQNVRSRFSTTWRLSPPAFFLQGHLYTVATGARL